MQYTLLWFLNVFLPGVIFTILLIIINIKMNTTDFIEIIFNFDMFYGWARASENVQVRLTHICINTSIHFPS